MTISRKPWERRLEDLAHLLRACSRTYFNPELFRRNTNQFLQTARTVTFIMQKNKSDIPEFDSWYTRHIVERWREDQIMLWAKDARNKVEKEGDLEINSTLKVSLVYSYLEEEDVTVPCGRSELVDAGIKQLVEFAKRHLPSGIADASGIRVERSWVTADLDSTELLQGLAYVYSRIYDCCKLLAVELDRTLPKAIPEPSVFAQLGDLGRQVQLVKIRDLKKYHIRTGSMRAPKQGELPRQFKERAHRLLGSLDAPHDFSSAVTYYRKMAEATFRQWKNHMAMLFLLDDDWRVQDMVTPFFLDQTDKYFFWRMIGEKVKVQKARCAVFTGEIWVRDLSKGYPSVAMSKLPIRGECLQTCLIDTEGNRSVTTWDIFRLADGEPSLGSPMDAYDADQRIFFFLPVMRAMGVRPDFGGESEAAKRGK